MNNPMVNKLAIWLVIIGGLNWLTAGIGNLADVSILQGGIVWGILGSTADGLIANIIYIVVGLAAIVVLMNTMKSSQ